MKKLSLSSLTFLVSLIAASSTAFAYESADDKPICKKPKFTDFSLPEYNVATNNQQVNPEAEFFFKLPADVDSSTISLTAKTRSLPFKVETTTTFHKVIAKLPASLTGYYVRIDAYAKSTLGCDNHHGWLIKVSGHEIRTPSEQ